MRRRVADIDGAFGRHSLSSSCDQIVLGEARALLVLHAKELACNVAQLVGWRERVFCQHAIAVAALVDLGDERPLLILGSVA